MRPAVTSILVLISAVSCAAQTRPRLVTGFHTGSITAMSMDSAERFLVTASDDQTVRVWDLPAVLNGELRPLQVLRLPRIQLAESRMVTAAISPDGATIAAAGPDSRSLYLFDRATGKLLHRLSGLPHVALQVAYSPDGRYLAASIAETGGVRLYRASDLTLASQDPAYQDNITWMAFSPQFARDGLFVTGSSDRFVRLYRVRPDSRLQLLRRRLAEAKDPPASLAFSPDGRKLAVSLAYPDGYPEVEVWDAVTLAFRYRAIPLNAMGGEADTIAWSTGGQYLYLAGTLAAGSPTSLVVRLSHDGTDRDFETVRACGEETDCSIAALLPLRNGALLFASANRDGIGVLDATWKGAVYLPAPVPSYRGLADAGRFLISPDGTSVRFTYDPEDGAPSWFSVQRRALLPADALAGPAPRDPDGLRGLGTSQVLFQEKVLPLHDETGLRAVEMPDKRGFLLTTEWTLARFDESGKVAWRAPLPAGAEAINVSADSRLAVAALIDGTIRWFSLKDGAELLALFPHPDRKRWILWTPDGNYDCSPAADDLLGFETSLGEDQPPRFQPASALGSKFHNPLAVARALGGKQ